MKILSYLYFQVLMEILCYILICILYRQIKLYILTINEKRGHGFRREHVRIYRRIWREEWEGGNDIIIILKIKNLHVLSQTCLEIYILCRREKLSS